MASNSRVDAGPAASHAEGLLPRSLIRWALVVMGVFTLVSATAGSVGLLMPGSMGLPQEGIEPFTSYLWPALILLIVIGGTQGIAVAANLRRWRSAALWGALAALALIIWIFVQLAMIGDYSGLHGVFFFAGVAQLALVLALLDVVPGLVRKPPSSAAQVER